MAGDRPHDFAPIRVACVGAGYFSRFHRESWTRMPGVSLVAVCDTDIDRARATGFPAHDRLDEMIARERPDLLDVIVPPPAQAATIRTALEAGISWIVCQKPFCLSLAEARAITAEAEAAGARLVIHENFRFQPWYGAIADAIRAGAIGDVHQVTFRLRPGDGQGTEAYLSRQPYFRKMARFLVHETAVHWIDTFRYLLGEPCAVYADLRRLNPAIAGEDAGYVLFDFPGGARALFDGNRHLDHASDNLRRTMGEALVEGTRGTITLAGDGSVAIRKFGSRTAAVLLPPDTSSTFGGDCVHRLQSHVVAAMRGDGSLQNAARDYLRVIEIEEAVYQSAGQGRKLPL